MKNIEVNNIYKYYALIIFILFFILFPFGQLARIQSYFEGIYIVFHPIDVITFLSLPYLIFVKKKGILLYINEIIFIFIASFIFSLIIFKGVEISRGFLYLVRTITYYSFSNLTYFLCDNNKMKKLLLNIVSISLFVFMIIGLYQFFYYYDLRDLFYIGWDNHYYRLTSTLFDPGFSASILIIGLYIFIKRKIILSKWFTYLSIILFTISILLTFSRAGYLSLIVITLLSFKKYIKQITIIVFSILAIILLIPKPHSSGVELYRTFSIKSRIENYKETFSVFKKYPIFGIGFNNYCLYKSKYLVSDNIYSHSCSGGDSSIFLILATTGVLGITVLLNSIFKISLSLKDNIYSDLLKISFIVILIGSFFNNNLFYNFLMGLLAIFLGLTRENIKPDN